MDDEPGALPARIEVLWGRADRPRRGPKPALSREQVVLAAVEIADEDGLGALSMSRVAGHLGFTTMSLYRYVSAKDELIGLIMDHTLGEPPVLDGADGWRVGLERWARDCLAVYRRHPWMLQVPRASTPPGPQQMAWLDAGLRALSETGLSEDVKPSIVLLLAGYVHNTAMLSTELPPTDGEELPRFFQFLDQLIDPERYPALSRVLAAGVFDAPDEDIDAEFELGLACTLDGVDALIKRRRAHRRKGR